MQLLVSKIGGIPVIQVGKSSLNVTHRSEDSSKVGGGKALKSEGTITTLDLGKGAQKYTLKFLVQDKTTETKVYKVLYIDRYTTIIDKYRGTLKVYVDSFSIDHDDQFANQAIFNVSCIVQDNNNKPVSNSLAGLTSLKTSLFSAMLSLILKVISNIILAKIIYANLKMMFGSGNKVKYYLEDGDSEELYDYLSATIQSVTSVSEQPAYTYLPITASITEDETNDMNSAYTLLNVISVATEVHLLLTANFDSQQQFEALVRSLLSKLKLLEDVIDVNEAGSAIHAYVKDHIYRKLVQVDIGENRNLVEYVYSTFGSLDNYQLIVEVNNFKECDSISGVIWSVANEGSR